MFPQFENKFILPGIWRKWNVREFRSVGATALLSYGSFQVGLSFFAFGS
jgi:hypothetical protein